jgi:phosphatidylinositol glycan class Q protein
MPEHDGLMRVFWPTDIARSDLPGVIVGWRNSGLDVVVVAVLDHVDVSAALLTLPICAWVGSRI